MFLKKNYRIENDEKIEMKDVLLNNEELNEHAIEIAKSHVIAKKRGNIRLLWSRLNHNFKTISSIYAGLNEEVKKGNDLSPASEWLLDNYYKIEEQVQVIRQNVTKDKFLKLHILDNGYLKGYPRVYSIALELVSHTDGRLDETLLVNFIKSYQSHKVLTIGEIWALSLMIRLALVEKIRNISEKIYENQEQWKKVERLKGRNQETLLEDIKRDFENMDLLSPSYIEHLLKKLRTTGIESGQAIDIIEKKLMEFDTSMNQVIELEHKDQAARKISIGNAIISLNIVSKLDWNDIFESLSKVEEILRGDPLNIYGAMDFSSRNYYRHEIEKIAKMCNTSETKVARTAISYAKNAEILDDKDKIKHVGYYIVDQGRKKLLRELNYKKSKNYFHDYPISVYVVPIMVITGCLALLLGYYAYRSSNHILLSLLAGTISLIPASDIAVTIVNWMVTYKFTPAFLPKLEYKEGVIQDATTMVVIPTLVPNEKVLEDLLEKLEVYYLGNKDKNIYFGVAGDFKDSDTQIQPNDELLIHKALEGIKKLNHKYANGLDRFFYFHRYRQFSEKQQKWMGWERKRGALVEFNELLTGSKDTSYNVISGDLSHIVGKIKYIITLDADTNLPIDTAKKLIGTISHPLNKGVLNKEKGIVEEGYGLIQPRIGVDVESASKSTFTRVFAGQGGIDPYTTATSDVYQDLFGEGIFTGKGIYNLSLFNEILSGVIPDNTVLSHDLLEGSYVRTALTTDIELIDGYPSRYNSFIMRLHRWIRGDWQLIRWLFPKIENRMGKVVNNPLSKLSKWKVLDNLRRSLTSLSLLLLFILGLTVFPGKSFVWVGFASFTLLFPCLMECFNCMMNKYYRTAMERTNGNLIYGFRAVCYQTLLNFIFLPYHAFMMVDGIVRTLYRVYISKKNLLEWVTAADVEKKLKNDTLSFIKRMKVAIIMALFLIIFVGVVSPNNLVYALPISLIWALSPVIAYKVSKENMIKVQLDHEDSSVLRRLARKTWSYYEDFAGEMDHFLPPDNYQEDPPNGVAHRTSPTNIGFLLLATLSARDFGYISTIEMVERIEKTLSTIERLETWKGHLYNWYDTKTLEVLRPFFVSTVDSGNFIGYMITLKEGLLEYFKKPILDKAVLLGIKDTVALTNEKQNVETIDFFLEKEKLELKEWKELFQRFEKTNNITGWNEKFHFMMNELNKEINLFFVDARVEVEEYKKLKEQVDRINGELSLIELNTLYKDILKDLNKILKKNNQQAFIQLKNRIFIANEHVEQKIAQIKDLIKRIEKIVEDTDFTELYDQKQNLFSIGYNVKDENLVDSYYDLLASEARLTSYIAIARKEVPKKHWSKLGRALSIVDGYRGLVSWTGTMFEYFMPPLVMKNYTNTLMDETYGTVIKAQKKYGEKRNVPWGTSESGYYAFDINLNYQYKAFGVPDLGLKRGLINDMVISPYSTLLALSFDGKGSMKNIKRLIEDGVEGNYGFYEAIDYTPERLPFGKKKGVIKSFMAHHQGMGLLALNNYLNENIMQKRFHMDPVMKSAEVLLQEKTPVRVLITKQYKEAIEPLEEPKKEDIYVVRKYRDIDGRLPRCHILSNGRYSVMVTDGGSGYSKKEKIQVTRWREDSLTGKHGNYIFLKNLNTNKVYGSIFDPIHIEPDGYEVKFSLDQAAFMRTDDNIDTHTEIFVSSEDDAEIRKITLTNHGNEPVVMELTSYFETVLAPQAADMAHPAFSNLFIRTEAILEYDSLIASRRPRLEEKNSIWMCHTMAVEGETLGNLEYETNRGNFIGRGRNIGNSFAFTNSLTNTTGPILDPIMSLRRRVKIIPGKTVSVSFVTSVINSRKEAIDMARKYYDLSSTKRALNLAFTRSIIETSYLGLKAEEIEVYQDMIPHILYLSPHRRKYEEMLKENKKGQSGLWAYGISGDLPIVLVSISRVEDIAIVHEALKAHEYWKMKGLSVDLIIFNEDKSSYLQPLQELLNETVFSKYGHDIMNKAGGIYVRNANIMPEEDRNLLYTVARLVLKGEKGSIYHQIRMKDIEKEFPEAKEFKKDKIAYKSQDELLNVDYFNGYGGFSKDGKEYIIRLKEGCNTPAPWTNVIANKNFGFHITENGSGFTWAENSRENKLTPWSNDPITDPIGEVIYLRDESCGAYWSVTPLPIREKESYTIRHGMGYSTFTHDSHGILQNLTVFVTKDESIKISLVKLKNHSDVKRTLSSIYYLRPVLGVSDQITQQYIVTKMDEKREVLMMNNGYSVDFPGRTAFVTSSEKIVSYTGDREEFVGQNKDLSSPNALRREGLSNRVGAAFDPCAAIEVLIELEPNEEKELVFLLGYGENMDEAQKLIKKYKVINDCKSSLDEIKTYWKELLGTIEVKTPDLSMDLLINYWLMYQTIACRIWARSAFYQSGGAYGFRDQLQDAMNAMPIMPEATRKQILLHCAHQFVEGDVQHWWHPGAGEKGIRTKFSDDLLWLPLVTAEYVSYTGDDMLLNEEVHFLEESLLGEHEDERYGIPRISEEKASVYEHCVRAIERGLRFGEHGIPLMGSGDWNDGMNTVGNKGKGESIWLGWFLHDILNKFASICEQMNEPDRGERYKKAAKDIAHHIEENAWDGEWYRRAYFDDGTPLGSIENTECMIDSLAQSWAVISGAARPDRKQIAMDSAQRYLVKKEEGMILLFTPPFNESDLHPGYIKGYVPGVRENGGQYTHAATWVINAFAMMGDGDKALELYNMINPINHTRTPIECATYKVEPYVIAADVYAVSPHTGRGGWTWYTGAAGWMYRVGIEYILGLKKKDDILTINPCIPKEWKEYTIKYQYKNTHYKIFVKNFKRVNTNVDYITIDGKRREEKNIPLVDDGKDHYVEVILGATC
ncbi:GH36-type glycosyl hydrolase domain-containing protein [Crassaminicella profunda]|uniref:GH36-type glycosyl hydrolase domain-containing protein n=1 Tax=Crassaminicella profunda TaxID=1286698 RepID=UPI001CA6BF26|nr:glucoamylase family protein [Crassaminicella profunda]QZY55792.1 glycosyl transferase [Crassaminicella profunda]